MKDQQLKEIAASIDKILAKLADRTKRNAEIGKSKGHEGDNWTRQYLLSVNYWESFTPQPHTVEVLARARSALAVTQSHAAWTDLHKELADLIVGECGKIVELLEAMNHEGGIKNG